MEFTICELVALMCVLIGFYICKRLEYPITTCTIVNNIIHFQNHISLLWERIENRQWLASVQKLDGQPLELAVGLQIASLFVLSDNSSTCP